MDLRIKGKNALVCASSKGLGYAVAQALAAEGSNLFLCARGAEALDKAVATLKREHPSLRIEALATDLARPGSAAKLAADAQAKLGPIDILVNNVGGPAPSAAHATNEAAWRLGFDQLFMSVAQLTSALIPSMRERHFGRIVTLTSLSVVEPIDHLAVSTAMRAAVTTYSKSLATELAPYGITVNTVMPGVIHTGRIEDLRRAKAERDGTNFDDEMTKSAQVIPMGRMGKPEELASLVAFLASPLAAYVTGTNIPVDGGLRKSWT